MKRAFSILLAVMLLFAAFPHAATGEETQSHTIEADRVLICNPLPYDAQGNTLYSGTLRKAQEDEEPDGGLLFLPGLHKTGRDLSQGRKSADTQDFWVCTDLVTYRYDKRTFRLAAEGAHCRIWTMEDDALSFTEEQTAAMLEQFETVIYPTESAYFGAFRDLSGDGKLEILEEGRIRKFVKHVSQITFAGQFAPKDQEVMYITERAVFRLIDGKVTLVEIAPGMDLEKDILANMDFKPEISPDLKQMDPGIFCETWGGLGAILEAKNK